MILIITSTDLFDPLVSFLVVVNAESFCNQIGRLLLDSAKTDGFTRDAYLYSSANLKYAYVKYILLVIWLVFLQVVCFQPVNARFASCFGWKT